MQYSWCKILLMAAALCLTASVSQAAVGHGHHSQTADSPFLSQHDAKKPHCVLLGHSMDKPCPHVMGQKRENSGQTVIASECGGSPLPSNSHRIGSKNIFSISEKMFEGSIASNPEKLSFVISFYHRLSLQSLEPPPKSL